MTTLSGLTQDFGTDDCNNDDSNSDTSISDADHPALHGSFFLILMCIFTCIVV
jgi:hypothetical protein